MPLGRLEFYHAFLKGDHMAANESAPTQPNNPNSPNSKPSSADRQMLILRYVVAIACLIIALYVVLWPAVAYAPVPKVVLFLLISLLPAILFGAEAASRLEFKIPGFVFTTIGAGALCFGGLALLTHYSKPEEQIAVFHILDENQQPVNNLDRPGAVQVLLTGKGLTVTKFLDGNAVVLIFPEQVGECELQIKPSAIGKTYIGKVTYSGNRESDLVFGKQLKAN